MSVQTALDNIGLRGTARWGHTEYSMGYHTAYLQKVAGVGRDASDFEQRAYDALAFDLHWSTNDGLIDWAEAGRCTDMGHAEYAADGSDRRMPQPSPFKDEYEVWALTRWPNTVCPLLANKLRRMNRRTKRHSSACRGN